MRSQEDQRLREELAAFIDAGHHRHPGPNHAGRLRTLHELNVAFARQADRPLPPGAAANELKQFRPGLHEQMRAMAPDGHLVEEVPA